MKYKYILLDWDGNLARTLDIWLIAYRTVLDDRNIFKTDQEIAAGFGLLSKQMIDWGVTDIDEAMARADTIAKEKLPTVELYPDALFVLEQLHKNGHKLALITTSTHENVAHLLENYGIKQLFDVIIAGDDTVNHKPHPEPLELALSKLNGSKDKAVMIGDSDKDLGAANNFGVDSILFYPDEHQKFYNLDSLQYHAPTHTVRDFKDILEIV